VTPRIVVVMQSIQPNGFEICEALVRKGFKLVLAETKSSDANIIASRLSQYGNEVYASNINVTNINSIDKVFSKVIEQFGRIDILVNNTIIDTPIPAEMMPVDHYWDYLKEGLKKVFFSCQLAARRMIVQEPIYYSSIPTKGIIVNITSIGSVLAFPGYSAFCSSMAAINTLSRILACEWGVQGIRVEVIVPGLMEFLSNYQYGQGINVEVANLSNPLEPQISAKVIAEAVTFLLCNEVTTIGTFNYLDNGYLSYGYI